MDFLPCRRHRALPDAAVHVAVYGAQGLAGAAAERPGLLLERFYYDTASASTVAPLAALTKVVKPTQILFGTDAPFASGATIAAGLRSTGLFDTAELYAIERGNAARIMPKYKT